MSRPLRLEYPDAWYHVMNRGLAQQRIFYNDTHRRLFLDLLFEIYDRYQIEIHTYCLMNNHYHLFIRTPLANLSHAMRHLNGVYTQRFNQLMNRDGPIFRGRYKSIVVDADSYLLQLSRYIHLNPVVAKLVEKAESYVWSSYQAYVEKAKTPCWLKTREILSCFGEKQCWQKYKTFVEEGVDKELNNHFKYSQRIPILGSKMFIKAVNDKYLKEQHKIKEIPAHKEIKNVLSLDKISKVIVTYYQLDILELKKKKRGKENIPRMAFMYLARTFSETDLNTIANKVGSTSITAVSRACYAFSQRANNEPKIRKDIEKLTALLFKT